MDNKISIIIPVFNLEKYIAHTLKSVCAQSYSDIEIIVVDDGSTDSSWMIINELAKTDSRIIPIHQENGGVTSARLNGVKRATGDWIGFVDGDDTVDEDMFEFLLNNAKEFDAQISHCGYKKVFTDNTINYYYYGSDKLIIQDNLTGLKDLISGVNPIRMLISAVPPLIALWRWKYIKDRTNPMIDIFINTGTAAAGVNLLGVVTSGILVGRIPIYFTPVNFIIIPWLMKYAFKGKMQKFMIWSCYILYFAYFLFDMVYMKSGMYVSDKLGIHYWTVNGLLG